MYPFPAFPSFGGEKVNNLGIQFQKTAIKADKPLHQRKKGSIRCYGWRENIVLPQHQSELPIDYEARIMFWSKKMLNTSKQQVITS